MEKNSDSNGLLKNTFILSIVQILNIIIKVLQNKVAAIVLGTTGMGILGLFNNSLGLLVTGAGLGISQSAVRDIAAADAKNDEDVTNNIFTIVNRVIWVTGIIGFVLTAFFSSILSKTVFGTDKYTYMYILLGFGVFFNIFSEGKLAVLKGKKKFRDLAKCTIFGSLLGLILVIPVYLLFKEDGIVPAILILTCSQMICSIFYVRKCHYKLVKMSFYNFLKGARMMIQMGISLMIVSFITVLFNLIVASFIRQSGDFSDVGIYSAGSTILTSYFGIVITAMSTDFYPRVSSAYDDNAQLMKLVNYQCLTCLSFLFPIIVLFVFAAPIFISILYSGEFLRASEYTDYAMIGTILLVCSNFLGIILLAKQKSKIFLSSVIFQRILLLGIYFLFFKLWNIRGLGFAYIFTGISDLILMTVIMKKFFSITLSRRIWHVMSIVLLITLLSILIKLITIEYLRYSLGLIIFVFSAYYSYRIMLFDLNISIVDFIKNKISSKK